jgi:hypothetical protein
MVHPCVDGAVEGRSMVDSIVVWPWMAAEASAFVVVVEKQK